MSCDVCEVTEVGRLSCDEGEATQRVENEL